MKRHLVEPANKISSFELKYFALSREEFTRRYWVHFTGLQDQWRVGKGETKLARIDTSFAEDWVEFNKVKLMVKKESYPVSLVEPKAPKKARGIQYTVNERTAYEFANHSYAMSKSLAEISREHYEIGGVEIKILYCSGLSHEDIGVYMTECERERRTWAFSCIDERDGKSWDATMQIAHREAVIAEYEKLDRDLGSYARTGVVVRGVYVSKDGSRIHYDVNGTVKSGHFDTTLGNGWCNRDITAQSYSSLPEEVRPKKVMGAVAGDDLIATLYFDRPVDLQLLYQRLNEADMKLGIQPERGLFLDVRHASFISLGFYLGHSGFVIPLPKVGRLFGRLFWTVTDLQGRCPRRFASTIAAAFYPLYQTYPPMRAFLKHHMHVPPLEIPPDADHVWNWSKVGLRELPEPINWAENHLVKYGPDAVLLEIDEFPDHAGLCRHRVVDAMLKEDLADPIDRMGCVIHP